MYNLLGYFWGKNEENQSCPVLKNRKKLSLLFNCLLPFFLLLFLERKSTHNLIVNDWDLICWLMIIYWGGSFARLIQTQSISGQGAITKAKEPDNWGNFLFFNWMQSLIILNVEKTFTK